MSASSASPLITRSPAAIARSSLKSKPAASSQGAGAGMPRFLSSSGVQRAERGGSPATVSGWPVQLSPAMKVSSPSDPAELEAERTAHRVMRMPTHEPSAAVGSAQGGIVLRAATPSPVPAVLTQSPHAIARQGQDAPVVSNGFAGEVQGSQSSGAALPENVKRFMEPRFGARFDAVKIHAGERAAQLSQQVSARAFTVGPQIFFGRDQYKPDAPEGRQLLAHELTHTIQQGAATQDATVSRAAEPTVQERTGPELQRSGWGFLDPINYIADKARIIPGFSMLTVLLGYNPITRESVDRSAGNILRAAIEMIPGGFVITQALDAHGIFTKVSAWASEQFQRIREIGSNIWQDIKTFIKGLSIAALGDLSGTWERGKAIVLGPATQIKAFAIDLKDGIISLIKEAVLKPLGAFAR